VLYCDKEVKDIELLVPIRMDKMFECGGWVTGNGMPLVLRIMKIAQRVWKLLEGDNVYRMAFSKT
jgi:hypothetical protein